MSKKSHTKTDLLPKGYEFQLKNPVTGVHYPVTRSQFYATTYRPTLSLNSSNKHWPKLGETMTDFMQKKKLYQSIDFIDQRVKKDPQIALKLLDQFQRKSLNLSLRTARNT